MVKRRQKGLELTLIRPLILWLLILGLFLGGVKSGAAGS